eukprot:7769142-Pyramimonas_sp.AAC.1
MVRISFQCAVGFVPRVTTNMPAYSSDHNMMMMTQLLNHCVLLHPERTLSRLQRLILPEITRCRCVRTPRPRLFVHGDQ